MQINTREHCFKTPTLHRTVILANQLFDGVYRNCNTTFLHNGTLVNFALKVVFSCLKHTTNFYLLFSITLVDVIHVLDRDRYGSEDRGDACASQRAYNWTEVKKNGGVACARREASKQTSRRDRSKIML